MAPSCTRALPHLAAAAGAYGLVGMGAVFAAAARAPITAVIIIFELTEDYRIILPLMFAIVVATALSGAISRDTIYTLKLRRRGIDVDQPKPVGLMARIQVAEAMGTPPRPARPDQPLADLVKRFATERSDSLPVMAPDGAITGVVAAVDVERAIGNGFDGATLTAAITRHAPELRATDSLEDAVQALGASDDEGVPVLDGNGCLVGWLTHRRLLRAYRERSRRQPAGARPPSAPVPDRDASST
jgi:CIC family chloride channel protein